MFVIAFWEFPVYHMRSLIDNTSIIHTGKTKAIRLYDHELKWLYICLKYTAHSLAQSGAVSVRFIYIGAGSSLILKILNPFLSTKYHSYHLLIRTRLFNVGFNGSE